MPTASTDKVLLKDYARMAGIAREEEEHTVEIRVQDLERLLTLAQLGVAYNNIEGPLSIAEFREDEDDLEH